MLLMHWLYGRGIGKAWRRAGFGRIVPLWRVMCFIGGEISLVAALMSPIDALGGTLLSGHMFQHILLTVVAPPLLVLGAPLRAWTWALPPGMRRMAASPLARVTVAIVNRLSRPITSAVLASAALWVWHAPVFFDAALVDDAVHTLEHAIFLITSLLFWRGVTTRHGAPAVAACATLAAFMASGMLGGLLVLAPVPIYAWYGGRASLWGMSGMEDQQLAGVVMWVPAGGVYLVAFAVLALRVASDLRGSSPRLKNGIIRASTSSRSMK